MKKLLVSAAIFGIYSTLNAAPVGNPFFPEILKDGYFISCNSPVGLRVGYEGDFINDARMKQQEEGRGRVDNYTQDTNSAVATINFFDRLDLYGVFGSSRVCCDWRFATNIEINRVELETGYHFLWAVGGRGIVLKWGDTVFGLGARYNAVSLKPTWTTINGQPIPTSGTRLQSKEWQVDFDVSHQIEIFVPYVGVKYSSALTKIGRFSMGISSSGSGEIHMRNRTSFGLVIGCTLTTGKYFMLNAEGRLIDERAATIAGDFRF